MARARDRIGQRDGLAVLQQRGERGAQAVALPQGVGEKRQLREASSSNTASVSATGRKPHSASNGVSAQSSSGLWFGVGVVADRDGCVGFLGVVSGARLRAVRVHLDRQRLVGSEHLQQERQPRAERSTTAAPSSAFGSAAMSRSSVVPSAGDGSPACSPNQSSAPAGRPARRRAAAGSPCAIPTRSRRTTPSIGKTRSTVAVQVRLEVDDPRGRDGGAHPRLGGVDRRRRPRRASRRAASRSSRRPAVPPGPRCIVRRWITRSTPAPASAASIARTWTGAADSPSSRLLVSITRMTATVMSSAPMAQVPMPSQIGSSVSDRQPDAEQREHQAGERGDVLEQDGRQFRHLRVPDEPEPAVVALVVARLVDRGAQREPLQADRDQQHDDRDDRGSRDGAGAGSSRRPRTARTGRRARTASARRGSA